MPDNKRLHQEANQHINPIRRTWVPEQSLRQDINIHETSISITIVIEDIPRQDSVRDCLWGVWEQEVKDRGFLSSGVGG